MSFLAFGVSSADLSGFLTDRAISKKTQKFADECAEFTDFCKLMILIDVSNFPKLQNLLKKNADDREGTLRVGSRREGVLE